MLLDAIASHLQANAIGTVGTDLFKSFLPDSPDAAVAIFEYTGRASDKAFGNPNVLVENARFQILVRSARDNVANAYATARTKAQTICTLLDGVGNLTLSGVVYLYIEALQPPFFLQRDDNTRSLIACNYEAQKHVG